MAEKNKTNPAHWVGTHADYLYAFALKRLPDPELCKDLVQDTFMSAIKNIAQFRGNSLERTWLTAILKNKINDHYRKNNSTKPQTEDLTAEEYSNKFFMQNGHWENSHAPQSWGLDNEDPLGNEELQAVLKRCLEKLPDQWARVISWKYLANEDSKNICKELNITPSNFWIIIHRAKVSLRACISKNWKRE